MKEENISSEKELEKRITEVHMVAVPHLGGTGAVVRDAQPAPARIVVLYTDLVAIHKNIFACPAFCCGNLHLLFMSFLNELAMVYFPYNRIWE